MKHLSVLILTIALGQLCLAQPADVTPRAVYVGMDVGRIPLIQLFRGGVLRKDGSFINIEPTVMWQQRDQNRFIRLSAGYTVFRGFVTARNIETAAKGAYIKAGSEYPARQGGMGWAIVLSHQRHRDQFRQPGSTFGDYVKALPEATQTRLGLELYRAWDTPLGKTFSLRFMPRINGLLPLNSQPNPYSIPYIVGAGRTSDGFVQISGSLSVQLHYRVRPKTIPSLENH
jgi:hypothetical protein